MDIKKLFPPDFRLIPWRQFNNTDFVAYDYKNGESQIIGYYNFYINDKTSEFGYELRTLKSNLICVWWQKKLIFKNSEKILDYIAYHQDGWKIRYLRYADTRPDSLPTRLQLSRDGLQMQLLIDEWELP